MKPTLYVETTIVSYLTGRKSKDLLVRAHQHITLYYRKKEVSMRDSIVEETRKFREELSAEFDNDLHKIARYYIDLQTHNENVYVTKEMLLREREKHFKS